MFAFAIWDTRRRELLLARDRLGIKPLYYAERDGGLVFASELKPILQLPEVEPRAELGGGRPSLHVPGDAAVAEHRRRRAEAGAGRVATVAATAVRCASSATGTSTSSRTRRSSEDELVEQLRGLLDESVPLHQVSDVPVGAFLSGGIDSSAVVATMARLTSGRVKTFSIGFDEADFDELAHARAWRDASAPSITSWCSAGRRPDRRGPRLVSRRTVRRHVGDSDLHGVEARGRAREGRADRRRRRRAVRRLRQVRRRRPRAGLATGCPRRSPQAGGRGRRTRCRRACAAAASCGTSRSTAPSAISTRRRCSAPTRCGSCSSATRSSRSRRHDPWATRRRISAASRADWMSALQYCDLQHYLPLDILTKVDRMTMAHSIEARPPLLDHRLVEFAATIPARFGCADGRRSTCSSRRCAASCRTPSSTGPSRGSPCRWRAGSAASSSAFARDLLLSETMPRPRPLQPALRRAAAAAARARPRSRPAAVDDAVVRALVPALSRRADQRDRDARARRTHDDLSGGVCRRILRRRAPAKRVAVRLSGHRILPMSHPHPRVAIVAASLDILGGQGVQARSLIEALRGDGYEVTFVPINPAFPRGLRWLRRSRLRTIVNQLLYLRACCGPGPPMSCTCSPRRTGRFCSRRCRRCWRRERSNKRVVLHYHSGEADDHLASWGRLVHPWLRLADVIVVPSEYLRGVFAGHGYQAQVDSQRRRSRALPISRAPAAASAAAVDAESRAVLPRRRRDRGLRAVQGTSPDGDADVAGYGSEEPRCASRGSAGGERFGSSARSIPTRCRGCWTRPTSS